MVKREITIWDILFWIAMSVLIIYIIAKLLGIIHSPEWLNLLPIITLAFAIGAFYQRLLVFMDRINTRTSYFKKSIDDISDHIGNLSSNIGNLSSNISNLSDEIPKISSKLVEHDERLYSIEKQHIPSKSLTKKRT